MQQKCSRVWRKTRTQYLTHIPLHVRLSSRSFEASNLFKEPDGGPKLHHPRCPLSRQVRNNLHELPLHFQLKTERTTPPRSSPLASLESAIEPNLRTEHNITHIVSILEDWPSEGPHHLTIDLDDSEMENLLVQLPSVCDFIDQALDSGGVVLVHCFAGISRSATCVIAYCKY